MSTPSKVRGVSLLELMIALLIGSLLLLGLVQIFSASRTAYQMSEGMSRVQENARFAMDFLQRDLRLAGHFGCVNDQAHWVKEGGDPQFHFGGALALLHPLNFAVSIQGYEASGTAPTNTAVIGAPSPGWAPGLPSQISTLSPAPVAGSDVLVLRYLSGRGTPVTAIAGSPGTETLTFPAAGWTALTEDGVATPTMFGIADCSHADVFAGNAVSGTVNVVPVGAPSTELGGRFTAFPSGQTVLYRANSIVYYVGMTPAPRNEPALYRARALPNGTYSTPEELVEGIERLQFLYGQDAVANLTATSPPVGNITVQNTASGILGGATTDPQRANQWRRVGLVQVGILARSPTPAAAGQVVDPDNYLRLLGTVYQPPAVNDGRYRASYETTVALRNRLFGN